MKTYKNFISFTLSLGIIFVLAYLSNFLLEGGKLTPTQLHVSVKGLPSNGAFMVFWGIVYGSMIAQISTTIANRCLRHALKIWVLLALTNLLFLYLYFYLDLSYVGVRILLIAIILVLILTYFYLRHTRYLWLFSIPILALYGYSLFLLFVI